MITRSCYFVLSLLLLAPAAARAAEEAETLVIHPMEAQDVTRWLGVKPDTTLFKEGAGSGRWDYLSANPLIRSTAIPHDWTRFSALQFWLHSARANGQAIKVLLYSNNPATEKTDLFGLSMTLDWEGWRLIWLPFFLFRPNYSPAGWNQIDAITLAGSGFGLEAKPDTVIHLDDVRLVRARLGAPAVLGDFETDAEGWRVNGSIPVKREHEPAHDGEGSLRWEVSPEAGMLQAYQMPSDWTPYTHLQMWVHSAKATGQPVKVLVMSDQPATPEKDCFVWGFVVNWQGWRRVSLDFRQFERGHEPAGWDKVNGLRFVTQGYGVEAVEGTLLHIDGVTLVNAATTP